MTLLGSLPLYVVHLLLKCPAKVGQMSTRSDSTAFGQRCENSLNIIDTASPCAPTHALQRCPKASVIRQCLIGRQIRAGRAISQEAGSLVRAELRLAVADEINAAFEA